MRIDNALGMFISEFITWCIIITTATVLHASGVTNIGTASDAAHALEPLVHSFPNAGFLAELIFAIGIVGLGLTGGSGARRFRCVCAFRGVQLARRALPQIPRSARFLWRDHGRDADRASDQFRRH